MKLDAFISEMNLTDAEFGARTGLSQSQVNRIKRGRSMPSWAAVASIERETEGKVRAEDFMPATETEHLGTVAVGQPAEAGQ